MTEKRLGSDEYQEFFRKDDLLPCAVCGLRALCVLRETWSNFHQQSYDVRNVWRVVCLECEWSMTGTCGFTAVDDIVSDEEARAFVTVWRSVDAAMRPVRDSVIAHDDGMTWSSKAFPAQLFCVKCFATDIEVFHDDTDPFAMCNSCYHAVFPPGALEEAESKDGAREALTVEDRASALISLYEVVTPRCVGLAEVWSEELSVELGQTISEGRVDAFGPELGFGERVELFRARVQLLLNA